MSGQRRSVTQRKHKEVEQTRVYSYHELTRRIVWGVGLGLLLCASAASAGVELVWLFLLGLVLVAGVWITGR